MRLRWLDLLAVLIVGGYIWLANGTEAGAADPVWRRAQERGVLVVGSDAGFRPFTHATPDGRWTGYDIDLVNELGRRLGLKVEWRQVGYDALFTTVDLSNPNHVDLLAAGIVLNPGEAWRVTYTQPYFDAGQQVVVPITSSIKGLNDLAGKQVAVQLGSAGETALRAQVASGVALEVVNTPLSQEQALQMMLSGAVDAVVVDNATALPAIHRQAARFAGGLTYEPYVLATPVAAYQLNSELDRVLQELKNEGWIARLNQRWFP